MDPFNSEAALSYARDISHPRLVGTPGEEIARQEITRRLTQSGLQVSHQLFRFSTAMAVFLALQVFASQILIVSSIWLSLAESSLLFLPLILLLVLIFTSTALNRTVQRNSFAPRPGQSSAVWSRICWSMGTRYASENIVATFPGASGEPGLPRLLLVAHYDSKSQRIPLVVRIALFTVSIGGSLLFAALMVLGVFDSAFTVASYWVAGVVLVLSIPLLFLDLGNVSPGAIDDASGVGVVLHLAEILARAPEIHKRLNVTILLTGAEELATMGALAYVLENQSALSQPSETGGLHVLNFDGPGVLGSLYLVAPSKKSDASARVALQDLVREACDEHGYRLGRFRLPGALFDHLPFADAGCDTVSLIAIGKDSRFVHSVNDSPDKLDPRGFEQAGRVGLAVVENLRARYENPKGGQPQPHAGRIEPDKRDVYRNDPILRFLVDRLNLTPNRMLIVAFVLGFVDLLIAWRYDLLYSGERVIWGSRVMVIGAFLDPPYLLTMFVMIPLFLRTFVWMADGTYAIFEGMHQNRLIRDQDLPTFHKNTAELAARYTRTWVLLAIVATVILQMFVFLGNVAYGWTYNSIPSPRLFLFRIPLGMLAIYGAASVLVRLVLLGDWRDLMKGIEPQVNPLHWDRACGYSPFTNYSVNLLGLFVGLATFVFTKVLFRPADGQVALQPDYDVGLFLVLFLVLGVGYMIFYHFPNEAARRAMREAKRRQLETISDQYVRGLDNLFRLLREESGERILPERAGDQSGLDKPAKAQPTVKEQMDHLDHLTQAKGLLENLPESPINQKALGQFGLSSVSIPMTSFLYNTFQFLISGEKAVGELQRLLITGSVYDILQGVFNILLRGKIS
ncbi:MAG: M28 family peptidase [Chloroflexi bacterium]|nr:M28 family peptidase [Chloroflexota bacterium]